MRHAVLFTTALALLTCTPAPAATILVDAGDQRPDGTCSLAEAIEAANTNADINGCGAGDVGADTIHFDPDITSITFTQPIAGTVDALRVTEELAIEGGVDGVLLRRSSTLDDTTPFRLIHVYNPTQTLQQGPPLHLVSMRFANGLSNGFSGDDADGGCLLIRGALSMTDVSFSGCRAVGATGAGGAVAQYGNGYTDIPTLEVVRASFQSNETYAGNGGGLYTESPDIDIVDSVFRANLAGSGGVNGQGGGLYVLGDHGGHGTRIERSTFAGNRAMQGGGGLFVPSPGLMRNITVSGNGTATGSGGGILLGGGAPTGGIDGHQADITIENSTIAGNSAGDDPASSGNAFAGGLYYDSPSTQAGAIPLQLDSVLFADNTARYNNTTTPRDLGAQFQITATGAHNLSRALGAGGSNYKIAFATAPTTCDPQLSPLAANGGPTPTRALQAGSCALDAGANPDTLATDQRGAGFPRVLGASADIGAFEGTSDVIFADGFDD